MVRKKIDMAMSILSKEEYRRRNLKIKNPKYIREIRFLRKLIRNLIRKVALFKMQKGKYLILLSESQWKDINDAWHMAGEGTMQDENFKNLENQINAIKENESENKIS